MREIRTVKFLLMLFTAPSAFIVDSNSLCSLTLSSRTLHGSNKRMEFLSAADNNGRRRKRNLHFYSAEQEPDSLAANTMYELASNRHGC